MMSGILQIIAGIAIVFFLPGFTLVNLLFPRKGELDPELDIVYRVTIGMGTSVVISIFVGFALNAISSEGHGYVASGPLWTSLLSLTAIFFVAGWFRGAYPGMGVLHPALYRAPGLKKGGGAAGSAYSRQRRVERLAREREMLLADLKVLSDRATTTNPQRLLYYRRRTEATTKRISQINDELKGLQSGRS